MLTAYMDESYQDHKLMCVGGWLCNDSRWDKISSQWQMRIDYESRKSQKAGLSSVSRYKASDLESFHGDFEGWNLDRKKLLTKKLIDILGRGPSRDKLRKPIGIACGLKIPAIPDVLVNREKIFKTNWAAYRLCMIQNLITLADTMSAIHPDDRVTVIYDRGPFGNAAQSAFESFKRTSQRPRADSVVTMTPMGGEDCVALQPADMLAFEGRKLVGTDKRDPYYFRRSLQRVIGNGLTLRVREITKEALDGILQARREAPAPPTDWKS